MIDNASTASTWHADLTDSVHALGTSTRELRAAHSNTHHTARTVDPARLISLPGLLTTSDGEPVRPHNEALRQLTDLYAVLEHHTRDLYENAALGYAHGAAQALAAVLRAERPHHVTLPRDADGRYLLAAGDLPDLAGSLTTAAGAHDLTQLRTRVIAAETAQSAQPANGQNATADSEFATDLADAAYAYGKRAERALHHLIRFATDRGFLHTR